MFGFICVVISAVNLFFGITGIYEPDPNQYWIALNFSAAWLAALAAIKDIVDESK